MGWAKLRKTEMHKHVIPKEMLDAIEAEPARYEMRIERKAKGGGS